MNQNNIFRKFLYSFGKIFWSIYFVLGIAVIGFFMAYIACGSLYTSSFILVAIGTRIKIKWIENLGRKIGVFVEYVQCYSIYVLLKIQPWLRFSDNFQSIYDFYGQYKTRKVMVICNHRSNLDTFILIGLIPGLRGMAKRSLFYNVFFAPIMWMIGFVPVEKGNLTSFREGIRLLKEKILDLNRPALVFPETTRCPKNFNGIGKFSEAVFSAALESHSIILPILIKDTDLILGRGDFFVNPFNKARFKILEAIEAKRFLSASEASEYTREILVKEYQCS